MTHRCRARQSALQRIIHCTLVALTLSLSACGGGGGASSGSSSSTSSSGSGSSSGASGGSSSGTTASFTVSATVSGLSGTGLILALNRTNDLPVAANGVATFSSALATGTAYSVTVNAQPANQFCVVGNGSGTIGMANIGTVTVSCSSTPLLSAGAANVVTISVDSGPTGTTGNVNIPYVSITVCTPGTTTCKTIDHVLVDTGSWGLRLFASLLQSQPVVALPNEPDPANSSNIIDECLGFADGYTWGPVVTADVHIGGETATGTPVQIIDDNSPATVAAPSGCTGQGPSLNSVALFGANGVLGVGVFAQDCGNACVNNPTLNVYYSCNIGTSTCTGTRLDLLKQVINPVALFTADNNGVIVQLPAIAAAGALNPSGFLAFGIGTQSNNFLGNATVLTANTSGRFVTIYKGQNLPSSVIDSGSNGFYFTDSITACAGAASGFYCPSPALSLTATLQGQNGQNKPAQFNIASLMNGSLNSADNAFNDIGGTLAGSTKLTNSFDWGLPFFYGRTVYFALESQPAGGSVGPYFAY